MDKSLVMWNKNRLIRATVIFLKHYRFSGSKNFHTTSRILQLSNIDETQEKLLNERLILVDENDCVKGTETKKECHLKRNILQYGMLHRAFSVFLFNTKGQLLLQQRSDVKVTFPGCITNTCCSHPLYEDSELVEHDNFGVKLAAKRRLSYELGIPDNQISLEDLRFLTRIHYRAGSDKIWGEHEIDYVFFMQKDVTLEPNTNEVKRCWYVSESELKELLQKAAKDSTILMTPWFKMINDHFLYKWWASLSDLSQFENDSEIHKMPGIPAPILQL